MKEVKMKSLCHFPMPSSRAFFYGRNTMSETLILIITIVAILIAIGLLLLLAKIKEQGRTNRTGLIFGIVTIVFILAGISFGLATKDSPVETLQIVMIDAIILAGYLAVIALFTQLQKRVDKNKRISNRMITSVIGLLAILSGITYALATKDVPTDFSVILIIDAVIAVGYCIIMAIAMRANRHKNKTQALSTRKVAFLGILIGLASALMLLGFPILPNAPYLKVEISGLIVFMALLWFDWKTALVVSLYTNFVHVFMPGSIPVILFLDEGVNFIATTVFILPMAIFLNKSKLTEKRKISPVLIISLIGVVFTTVVMTLYNAFINLPLIYGMEMPFSTVFKLFGVFNLVKWGFVAIAINLTWRRLYSLRNFGEEEACEAELPA